MATVEQDAEIAEIRAYVDLCWTQVRALSSALEGRTREGYRDGLMRSDDRLGDLEAKAQGLAEALHDIRLLRRFVSTQEAAA